MIQVAEHITLQTLDRFHRNELAEAGRRAVNNHILWCSDCRRLENEHRDVVRFFNVMSGDHGTTAKRSA